MDYSIHGFYLYVKIKRSQVCTSVMAEACKVEIRSLESETIDTIDTEQGPPTTQQQSTYSREEPEKDAQELNVGIWAPAKKHIWLDS